MANPRITSIYSFDIYYIYLYLHFGAGNDFIFKIDVKPRHFTLTKAFIFKISNPFFGISPVSFKTPICHHWCCITIANYAEKSFLKFYEIEHEALESKNLKPYGIIDQSGVISNTDISSISDDQSFNTLYVMNVTGKVEHVVFDHDNSVSSDDMQCLVLMENGDVMNVSVSRVFKIQINNLYLSSRQLNMTLKGKY